MAGWALRAVCLYMCLVMACGLPVRRKPLSLAPPDSLTLPRVGNGRGGILGTAARLRGGAAPRGGGWEGRSAIQDVSFSGSYDSGEEEEEHIEEDGEDEEDEAVDWECGGEEGEADEEEIEGKRRQMGEILADSFNNRKIKNMTLNAFHAECDSRGMKVVRLLDYLRTFMDIWHPDHDGDAPTDEHIREFNTEFFPFAPYDQRLIDEWKAYWGDRPSEEVEERDVDVWASQVCLNRDEHVKSVAVPRDCETIEQALGICSDGGEILMQQHMGKPSMGLGGMSEALYLGVMGRRQVTLRGAGAGGEGSALVDFWGRVMLCRESGGHVADMRILGGWGGGEGGNESGVAMVVVTGEWSMDECVVRSSVVTSIVVGGGGGKLTVERCSIGGIGDAESTEYAERLRILRLEEADANAKVQRANDLVQQAREWHNKTMWDGEVEHRLRDPETSVDDITRQGKELWEEAEVLLDEAKSVHEGRLSEVPKGMAGGSRGWEDAEEEEMELAVRRSQLERDTAWIEFSARCQDALGVCGKAKCLVKDCTLSLASTYGGSLIRIVGRGSVHAEGCSMRDSCLGVSLRDSAHASLAACTVEGALVCPLAAHSALPESRLALSNCTIRGRLPFPVWHGDDRPGSLEEDAVRCEQVPGPFDDDDWVHNAEGAGDDVGEGGWVSEAERMEAEAKANLETRLHALQLGGEMDAPDTRPGRGILFADDAIGAPV